MPPEDGLYWIHVSTGLMASTAADVRLRGTIRNPNILRSHNGWNAIDTTSRDELTYLNKTADTLTVSSDGPLYSDQFYQTAFCGFQLNNIMDPVIAFSVGRSFELSQPGRIPYDLVNVDTNRGWNTDRYAVPVTGTWVITITVGIPTNGDTQVDVYAPEFVTSIYFFSTNNPGTDTISKTIIVPVNAGSVIYTYLTDTPVYSDIRYQTALMGFLYSLKIPPLISWFVATETTLIGTTDPVAFDVVLINEGSGWNIVSNIYTVPVKGIYYIQMTAGIITGYGTKMELVKIGTSVDTVLANVFRSGAPHNGYDCRGRAIIVQLQANDKLKIRLPSGYRLFSDTKRITTFSGFRIHDLI